MSILKNDAQISFFMNELVEEYTINYLEKEELEKKLVTSVLRSKEYINILDSLKVVKIKVDTLLSIINLGEASFTEEK